MSENYLVTETGRGYRCNLCPHFCNLRIGEKGKCNVRKAIRNGIELLTYGYLTNIAVEPIEKKPFKFFAESTKTLSAGSIGCNFSCTFCENYTISQESYIDRSVEYHPEKLPEMAIKTSCSSVCLTYNEPTIAYEYLIDVAKACHRKGLIFIFKSNAFINKQPWIDICKVSDAINIDWKGNISDYKNICGVSNNHFGDKESNHLIKDRIREAVLEDVHVEISVPVYSNITNIEEYYVDFCNFILELDKNIPIHLLRIIAANKWDKKSTSKDLVKEVQKFLISKNLNRVCIQD